MIITRLSEEGKASQLFQKIVSNALEKTSLDESLSLKKKIDQFFHNGINESDDTEIQKLQFYTQLQFYYLLEKLKKLLFINYSLTFESKPFSTLYPLSSDFCFNKKPIFDQGPFEISKFMLLRVEGEYWILETPLSSVKIRLESDDAYKIIGFLSRPVTIDQIKKKFDYLHYNLIDNFLILLKNAGVLENSETKSELVQWEFHDLYFHTRSRLGRHNNPAGAQYPFVNKIPPPSLLKERISSDSIPLLRPLEPIKKISFLEVLEKRKSIREPGGRVIHVNELSEFLYHAARIKKSDKLENMELSYRPSPNGGAIHELEIYPLVSSCEGLKKGLYRYDPFNHELEPYPYDEKQFDILFKKSRQSMGVETIPQILFIISARFNRVSWKYRTITYSIILKNTGALIQTMYLVATSMSLAPCANGAGDSDCFAKLANTNYFEETSVGEFALSAL